MDMIRAGLGDEQISYLGISYGTYLGAIYATLFPDRVRALVLDAPTNQSDDTVEQQYLTQIVGLRRGLRRTGPHWCEGDDRLRLPRRRRRRPRGTHCARARRRTGAGTATGVWPTRPCSRSPPTPPSTAKPSGRCWPQALADAEEGEPATSCSSWPTSTSGAHPDGTYASLHQSIGIILCASGLDGSVPDDPEALLAELQELARGSPPMSPLDDFAGGERVRR